ncbi:unnamed protein product [Adineta ricciae]|uniref:Uncharacterized protein n=1 Tax=Adineta ricciae TaxID=249248 RepID=A0A815LRQ3_ADIRI|nr:unnamed protein product [Adineta ricciae]
MDILKINLFDDEKDMSLVDKLLFHTNLFRSFQTTSVTLYSPSQSDFEQLIQKYPSTLSCSCSQTSIRHDRFLSFHPQYHPICSSQFINQTFISSISNVNVSNYYNKDYRVSASSHFQILALLCRTSQQMISDSLKKFFSQYLSTTEVISIEVFDAQMDYLVGKLKTTSVNDQQHTSDFLQLNIFHNGISSALQTNYVVIKPIETVFYSGSNRYFFGNISCTCNINIKCIAPAIIYQHITTTLKYNSSSDSLSIVPYIKVLLRIPGIKVGCLPYNSLLQSTLECFYNQLCINQIQKHISAFSLVSPLLLSSHFSQNTTVNDLSHDLFIESWNEKRNFSAYYESCAPQSCTYSYDRRFNLLYVIVTLISIFGSLKMILYFCAPFIIKLFRRIQKKKCCSTTSETDETEQHSQQNLQDRLMSLISHMKMQLMTLNLFPMFSNIKDGLHSTRLYLVCLVIGMIILIFYTSISVQTRIVTVFAPSLDEYEYLYNEHSSTLKCPCSHLSMSYSSIIDVEPEYHQVCSSDFIKSDVWLLYFRRLGPVLRALDFRAVGLKLFTILQTMCQMANDIVRNELIVFNEMQFVSAYVISRDTFHIQISTLIQRFQQQTVNTFLSMFQLVRVSIQRNQFVVGDFTNIVPREFIQNNVLTSRYLPNSGFDSKCSCGESSSCTRAQGFYCTNQCNYNQSSPPNQIIPGLMLSCLPVDSLLSSSLQCFYNSTCLQMILQWRSFGSNISLSNSCSINVTPLNPMINSRFRPDTKMESIISELFIEKWTNISNFTSYYSQCSPKECTYTYEQRFNRAFIIATIFGIVGGLSTALEILIPLFVILLRRIYSHCFQRSLQIARESTTKTVVHEKCWRLMNYFHTLNLYKKTRDQHSEDQLEQRSRIATRVYLLLFLISLLTIIIFITFTSQINSITVSFPSQDQFHHLQTQYSSTLSCPCSQIRISYSKFVTIIVNEYHQICSSDFISTDFITMLWSSRVLKYYIVTTDGKILSTQFRLLSALCLLAKDMIEQQLQNLYSHELITLETLSQTSFDEQIESIIDTFIVQSLTSFRRTHQFVIDMLHGNQLQNIFLTNWDLGSPTADNSYRIGGNPTVVNESGVLCSCDSQSTCARTRLINVSKQRIFSGLCVLHCRFVAPFIFCYLGLVIGCLPVFGLRLSTLECLHHQQCLTNLSYFFNSSYHPSPLNSSIKSRFTPISSTTIGTMIDELFIESWQNTTNYSNYYSTCSPSMCRYSYVTRNSVVYMLTIFLGLYGGLTEGLKIIVWYSLWLLWKIREWIRKRRSVVTPINDTC